MLRAVRQENKEKIETLIENCGDVNAASSTLGNTILIYSAQSGNEEIVNLLIEKGGLISESFSILQQKVPNHYPELEMIQCTISALSQGLQVVNRFQFKKSEW